MRLCESKNSRAIDYGKENRSTKPKVAIIAVPAQISGKFCTRVAKLPCPLLADHEAVDRLPLSLVSIIEKLALNNNITHELAVISPPPAQPEPSSAIFAIYVCNQRRGFAHSEAKPANSAYFIFVEPPGKNLRNGLGLARDLWSEPIKRLRAPYLVICNGSKFHTFTLIVDEMRT